MRTKIDNLELEYFVDQENRKIHLLEINPSYFCRLADAVAPDFQKKFIYQENLPNCLLDFEWVCYVSGGLVLVFYKYTLAVPSEKEKTLYAPFLSFSEGT